MTVTLTEGKRMTAQILVKIVGNDGTKIYLTVDEARDLRDFLVAEQSITPVPVPSKG